MRQQARRAALLSKGTVKGVKGTTIVAFIPKLNLSKCVYVEYMHGVCLGVVKQFLNLWFTVPGPWNISGRKCEIDQYLRNIAPSSDIGRLPRGVSEMKHWKASELRSWLLFYSLPCISNQLPIVYVQHWSLLVSSIFLLLQEEITQHDLSMAEAMLRIFVREIANLYRLKEYVYNVHQLLHLAQYVKWWGPLWSTSAFGFENYNGNLVNLIHGTKNPGKELMRNIRIAHGVEILRNKVYGKNVKSTSENCSQPLNVCYNVHLSEEDQALLAHSGIHEIRNICSRARKGREVFTSKLYKREKKRNNYTVKFKTPSFSGYGEVKFFVPQDRSVSAVVDKFRINHTQMFIHNASAAKVKHIVPIENLPVSTVVVNVADIVAKVIRVGNYVCFLPNSYEKNL